MKRFHLLRKAAAAAVLALAWFTPAAAPAAQAQTHPQPFAAGDPKIGKTLSDKDCVACHARRFDGHAEQMYLRPDHRVRTPEQLAAQVAYCNTQLGTDYFPEEEEHIAAYLNLQYYKFKP